MSLIKRGSLFDFSVKVKPHIAQEMSSLGDITTVRELVEVTRKSKPISFDIPISQEERGLALKSITLNENFECFLDSFSNGNLYIVSTAWDLSDKPISYYPTSDADPSKCIFKVKAGNYIEFPGEGIQIFPKRKVQGGIAYRIMIMKSEKDIKDFGTFFSTIGDTIRRSELSYFLGVISKASGINGASVLLLSDAVAKLTNELGSILKTNSDDYVDYLEGYYPISDWVRDFDEIENKSSAAVLNRF